MNSGQSVRGPGHVLGSPLLSSRTFTLFSISPRAPRDSLFFLSEHLSQIFGTRIFFVIRQTDRPLVQENDLTFVGRVFARVPPLFFSLVPAAMGLLRSIYRNRYTIIMDRIKIFTTFVITHTVLTREFLDRAEISRNVSLYFMSFSNYSFSKKFVLHIPR